MDITLRLHNAVKAVCPAMDGVSLGETKSDWRVSFLPEATAEQRAAAQAVIDTFDLEAEKIIADNQQKAKELLESSDIVVIRSMETGGLSQAWKDYRAALREVVRGVRDAIPEQPSY